MKSNESPEGMPAETPEAADTKRLDFLLSGAAKLVVDKRSLGKWIVEEFPGRWTIGEGNTGREAIDAARSGMPTTRTGEDGK